MGSRIKQPGGGARNGCGVEGWLWAVTRKALPSSAASAEAETVPEHLLPWPLLIHQHSALHPPCGSQPRAGCTLLAPHSPTLHPTTWPRGPAHVGAQCSLGMGRRTHPCQPRLAQLGCLHSPRVSGAVGRNRAGGRDPSLLAPHRPHRGSHTRTRPPGGRRPARAQKVWRATPKGPLAPSRLENTFGFCGVRSGQHTLSRES